MATKYAPHTMSDAAKRAAAKVGKSNVPDMCAAEVIRGIFAIPAPYKWGGNGSAWAINYFKGAQKVVKTSDPMKIPKGAMVFWDARPGATTNAGRAGHVAVGAGGGYCYSTDLPTRGKWGKIKITEVQRLWGKKLVGYVLVDGMGYTLTDPTTAPPVAAWGKPSTWQIGSTGPDVVRLGERVRIWSKHYGLPDPYTVGPSSPFTETDVKGLSKVQQKFFPKASTAKGGGADGYPGPDTFKRLAADPPSTPPPPPAKQVVVETAYQNFAGNNARGIATAGKRIPRYVEAREDHPVDVIGAIETTVASRVRGLLDSGLKPLGYVRRGGGKGRYSYPNEDRVKVIWAGLFTVPSKHWYKKDDKQAAGVIYEKDGCLGMDVFYHLESDDASGDTQVLQIMDIAWDAVNTATHYGVPLQNILLTGDANSTGKVPARLDEANWRNTAEGTQFLNAYTFMGWDGKSRKRFDYGHVRHDALEAELEALSRDTDISDHAGLRFRRVLTPGKVG